MAPHGKRRLPKKLIKKLRFEAELLAAQQDEPELDDEDEDEEG